MISRRMEEQRRQESLSAAQAIGAAVGAGATQHDVFRRLHAALSDAVGFKVITILKLDSLSLRSLRLYSIEPSYPIGGSKQHVRNSWSEAILDRRAAFVAHDLAALRATFPDSAAIEAAGCGSIVAAPIIDGNVTIGTMN